MKNSPTLILLVLATGCRPDPAPLRETPNNHALALAALSNRLDQVEALSSGLPKVAHYQALSNRLDQIDAAQFITDLQIGSLSNRVRVISSRQTLADLRANENRAVAIDTEKSGYQKLNTTLGILLIATASVEPYLDGFKVNVTVGNPSNADFNGFTVISSWGPAYSTNVTYEDWESAWKRRTNNFSQTLSAGAWNKVELLFAPATPEELRNANITVELSQLSLKGSASR